MISLIGHPVCFREAGAMAPLSMSKPEQSQALPARRAAV